jgi:FtsP/CotA-like multicopper oxidase with cupredoxin domain
MDNQGGAWRWFAVIVSVLALIMAVVAVGIIAAEDDDASTVVAEGGEAAAGAPTILLGELYIKGDLMVPSGTTAINVVNEGAAPHNLVFDVEGGPATSDLNGGESATLDISGLDDGTYTVYCSIPGHREGGMEATLMIGGHDGAAAGDGGSGTSGSAGSAGEELDYAAMSEAMSESILAFPAQTEGRGNQPLEPTILPDGTKEFELTASIIDWEVEPGRTVKAWAYNEQVPGPWIQLDVGDKVRVNFHNELPMGTEIHWHGIIVPNAMDGVAPLTQPLVEPGESFTYEFTAEEPAVGMYHAHHHGQIQVPNGLFAPMTIGDLPLPTGRTVGGVALPDEIEPVQEIPMVLNDAGAIGLTLNGKSFPATEPYVVEQGDWLLVHYYNEGLQIHPMHTHGFPQLVVAKDGFPLDQPYWSDTVNVAPGERFSVLVHAEHVGAWVWHCHILTHVERAEGVFGMLTAIIVEEPAA